MPKNSDIEDLMKVVLERIDRATEETRKDMAEVRKDVSTLAATSARQEVILEEHIRRTEANEKALALLEDKNEKSIQVLAGRVVPLEGHVAMWSGAGKVLVVLGTLASIAAAAYKFFF